MRTLQMCRKVSSNSSAKSAAWAGRFCAHHRSILAASRCARLASRSFTSNSELRDEFEAVDVVAALDVFGAFVDRLKQARLLLRIEAVLHQHQLHFGALGQVGRLVEHEPAVVDVGFERLHRFNLALLGLCGERGHELGGAWRGSSTTKEGWSPPPPHP